MYGWLNPLYDTLPFLEYKDWQFTIGIEDNGAPFLQIVFEDPTMDPTTQYCRKWLLYETMNVSEFVRTAWLAVMTAEEHEARERFAYKGRHVMSPHFDVDKLAELSRYKTNLALSPDPAPTGLKDCICDTGSRMLFNHLSWCPWRKRVEDVKDA